MQPRDYLRVLRLWIPLAFVLAVVAAGGAYAITKYAIKPIYSTQVVMQLKLGLNPRTASSPQDDDQYAETAAEVASQPPVLQHAIGLVRQQMPQLIHPDDLSTLKYTCSTNGQSALFACSATSPHRVFAAAIANFAAQVVILDEHNWGQARVRVVSAATVPRKPSSPHPPLNGMLAGALVFLLVLGAGLGLTRLDDSIRGEEDLKKVTGLPLLGIVPRIRRLEQAGPTPSSLIVSDGTEPAAAEAFRLTRAAIALDRASESTHTILVTSALEGEGKSAVAANLAAAFAETGKSVILVELDVRRPTLAGIFGVTPREGLTTALVDDFGPERYLVSTGIPGLRLLPSGPAPANPSALIGSSRMEQVVEFLASISDVLILDGSPLLGISDGTVAASLADGAIVVVRPALTTRKDLGRAVDALRIAGVPVLGLVVNGVPRSSGEYSSLRDLVDYGSRHRRSRKQSAPVDDEEALAAGVDSRG